MADRAKGTILVVDDTVANRWVVSRILEEAGYHFVEAGSGADALRLAAERPDLIVLDVRLPDANGFELARKLKGSPRTADIPLLMLSASFTTPTARAEGLESGADGYLTHPVEPMVLVATVRALLRGREVELALRESEARFRAMADTAPVMIWIGDATGGREWFNRRWLEHTGRSLDAERGMRWLERMHEDDREECLRTIRERTAAGESYRLEYRLARADDVYRWMLDTGVPQGAATGSVTGYIGSCVDITDRKMAETEREELLARERAARAAAEQANLAKAEFLAAMSHELRTPLNAIGGYVDLLDLGVRGELTELQKTDLGRIRKSQRHLLAVINNILNFAKVEAGHVEYRMADVPLHELVGGIEALVAPQIEEKHLSYHYGTCDPSIVVRTDPDKVQQILLNLLSNAIKFTPAGGRVSIECDADERMVTIRVRDTGRGIPAAKLEDIFEPFVQVEQHFAREGHGTGLGLSISRDLARALGGDLTVESVLGAGAVFSLHLPRQQRGSAPSAERAVAQSV